jgi:hypothetical protein
VSVDLRSDCLHFPIGPGHWGDATINSLMTFVLIADVCMLVQSGAVKRRRLDAASF